MTSSPLPLDARVMVGAFLVSGTVHLVRPKTFMPAMPKSLPAPRELIVASGVAELVCAAGLVHPRTRRLAALASTALLVGVFPGNLKMAADAFRSSNRTAQALTLARLPLQAPMIRAVWHARRA